jgi:hypothetical protein
MSFPDQDSQPQEQPSQPESQEELEESSPPDSQGQETAPEEGEQPEGGDQPAEGEGEEEKPEAPKPEGHKRAGGFQRKIDRLERQNQILAEQLARLSGQPATPAKPDAEKTPEQKAAEYIDTLVGQRLAALEAQRQQQAQQAEFQRRISEVRASHEDFDDALESVAHIPVPAELNRVLLTSPKGAEIMYQLAKNPAELARISALPPLDAAREVGRLEAKASGATPQTPKPGNRPPAPPSKVGGAAAKPTGSLESLSMSDYKRAYRSGRR